MNLANKLTLTRIILVPVFLFFVAVKVKYGTYIATGIFIIAALTDTLDGYIARSRNQITKFGKFMDPLADKLIVTSALISLVEKGVLSTWVVMIIIAREFAITGLRSLAASEGIVIAASNWGKAKTVTQIIAIVAALIGMPYSEFLIGAAVIITLISGLDYLIKNKNAINPQD
ncbi:CDP-diacylglycerol--glycerol-3-phosphate 3-phosphatidyltransferase [Fervidicella metallireducens AeB]|uniref:CDP-diacylglycerol--glycerol-3-phosphate 3-phosphatidyltransferase n=1 Tax=Fervidicella metallireducens AeB TaxID=1403537 RepID=A0A017RUB6_9CLOT|nr:CDP-diacylglycerol--glycerol-3-phosphate 3-phosphatidyltransferase [Fervidicella metallireducens]EYE88196.1 CDP-diacylglycerol--glycerol-3-phosphate 3-phosphatidyltransferase [Fervidicella metallireducens AeB]